MTLHCLKCGQPIPLLMTESEYREVLSELGDKNRVSKWLRGIEREEGLTAAMEALSDYTANGCGVSG